MNDDYRNDNNNLIVNTIPYNHAQFHENATLPSDDVIELGDTFDYEGYQVVRREFFAHMFEPSITFNNSRLYVNTACLNKFKDSDYVQILVNRESRILAIRPCEEGERDSFLWCKDSKGKRVPKQITCRIFFVMVADLLEWNPSYRYKLLGKVVHANGEYLIVFDLNSSEVYARYAMEGGKQKYSRRPVFPESWKGQFGMPYKEHQQSLHVNIFDGYAIYGIIDDKLEEQPAVEVSTIENANGQSGIYKGGKMNE